MSQSKPIPKLISRFEIGFDNETKVEINALKSKLDEVTRALSVKNDSHGDRLLAAMQAEAANDQAIIKPFGFLKPAMDKAALGVQAAMLKNLEPVLKQMGQWVFEGQDEKWVGAAKDADNEVWLFQVPVKDLARNENEGHLLWYAQDGSKATYLCDLRSNEDWKNSAIDRETVNDVEYLSESGLEECVPHIDDAIDQSDWLSESVPQITQADMQLIFIKNLSDVLIQRMHSMDRFSEDDYAIGGIDLMAWDIVANPKGDFAVITGHNQDKRYFGGLYFVPYARGNHAKTVAFERANEYLKTLEFCTITESQLPAFRAALEACYA